MVIEGTHDGQGHFAIVLKDAATADSVKSGG